LIPNRIVHVLVQRIQPVNLAVMKQEDRVESGEASRCHAVVTLLLFSLVCAQAIVDLRVWNLKIDQPGLSPATDNSDKNLNSFYDKLIYLAIKCFDMDLLNLVIMRRVTMLKAQYFWNNSFKMKTTSDDLQKSGSS